MGFLERARSQRGRHQRQRSVKVDQSIPEPAPTTTSTTPATRTLKSKRKSLFPGTGVTTTSCEATRPRSRSATTGFYSQADSNSRNDQRSYPPNMQFVTGNDSFRFPSPALVNNSTKKSPPTSVAHLPSLAAAGNDSTISTPGPQHTPGLQHTPGPQQTPRHQPPSWTRSHTAPIVGTPRLEALPQPSNWEHTQQRPQLKKQKSAWKTFGSFFKGNKQARQPIPDQFYQIQPPSNDNLAQSGKNAQGRMGVLESPVPSPITKDEPATVARVDSGHGAEKGAGSLMPPPNRDAFPMRTSSRVSANFFEPMPDSAGDGPRRTPRLDVSIPDSGLDRYSVMFEKLLEPKVSLIERRKSKRLNNKDSGSPVGGSELLGAKKSSGLQRSLTSPSLNREPSLTIHIAHSNRANRASTVPTTQSKARVVSIRPQAPRRSMTAPNDGSTPVSVPFESKTPNTALAAPLPASTTTASSPRCSIMSENSLPPTPNTATSISSSINTTVFGPSSSPPKASSSHHQQDDTPPVPPLPNRSSDRPPLPRQMSGTERFNRQIVQVSVARQVSVSKARRRVADAVEVKQPLRPRVVELGKNRKSTLVLIEGGD